MNVKCDPCWNERHVRCKGDGCPCKTCGDRRSGDWSDTLVAAREAKTARKAKSARVKVTAVKPPLLAEKYEAGPVLDQPTEYTFGKVAAPKTHRAPIWESVRAVVLQCLAANPGSTTKELSEKTGKARTQVSRLVNELLEANVVASVPVVDGRARRYRVAHGYVLDGKVTYAALVATVPHRRNTSRPTRRRGPNGERTGIGGVDSKFTAQQMNEIRAQLAFTSVSELARQYQCARKTIMRVRDHQFTNVKV